MSGRPFNRFREALEGGRGRPLAIAHRGDSFFSPENTLIAATLAHRSRADAWEFDVQLTQDGVPIVLHDPSLCRTTDAEKVYADDPRADLGYLVAEFSAAEIRTLDAGAWFLNRAGGPRTACGFGTLRILEAEVLGAIASRRVVVPTLEEALEATIGLDWLANVELKSSHDGDFRLVDAVLAVVERVGAGERVLISSFDHAEVARVVAIAPGVATGVLSATPLHRPATYVRDVVGADVYHISSHAMGATGATSTITGLHSTR